MWYNWNPLDEPAPVVPTTTQGQNFGNLSFVMNNILKSCKSLCVLYYLDQLNKYVSPFQQGSQRSQQQEWRASYLLD